MANPAGVSYSAEEPPVCGGRAIASWFAPVVGRVNGTWTMQSAPQAEFRNGSTYFGWVANNGDVGISRHNHDTGVTTHFVLAPAFQANGHVNATVSFLPDGRLICFYCKHNDYANMRYRISTHPEDISAWGTELSVATSAAGAGISYNSTFYLSNSNKTYFFYRAGNYSQRMRATVDGTSFDTDRVIISNGTNRPYVSCYSDGVGRVDFLFCSGNPAQIDNSIYHAYMLVDGAGVETWFDSLGNPITAPATPTNASLVYLAEGGIDGWNWDIIRRPDGELWALWTKFVVPGTDHRVMFSRFNGSEWMAPVEITPNGGNIDMQTFSDGQAAFDQRDPRIVYLGAHNGPNCELQAWRTGNSGTTWKKVADITSASGEQNFSPCSPANHDNRASVLWLSGTQIDYLSFNTNVSFARRK